MFYAGSWQALIVSLVAAFGASEVMLPSRESFASIANLSRSGPIGQTVVGVTLIDGAFGPVYGQPAWLVRRGHGSFVTFEFGEPRLEVDEPELRLHVFSPKVRERIAKRPVAVHGACHLWIYCCTWRLTHRGRPIARSESRPQRIDSALAVLDGQALVSVSVDTDARSTFTFDLGCSLLTWPYDDASEQWLLYEPGGQIRTVRADGSYSHESGATPAEDSQWHPLAGSE